MVRIVASKNKYKVSRLGRKERLKGRKREKVCACKRDVNRITEKKMGKTEIARVDIFFIVQYISPSSHMHACMHAFTLKQLFGYAQKRNETK